jgi:hypothetical protein
VSAYLGLEPEVPGELGKQTRLDATMHPPRVDLFHLDFTNWGGDDLVECFPCFAVTPALAAALRASGFTGFSLVPMVTTMNPVQAELRPGTVVPPFERFMVSGRAGKDDAGTDARHVLVISDRLWSLLAGFAMNHCETERWSP